MHCRCYFESFLPGLLHRSLLEGLQHLTCSIAYRVLEAPEAAWRIEIEEGRLKSVIRNGTSPVCCYVCDAETLLDIISGREPPQEAFFDLRVEIEGDIEWGLRLSTVLESFFQRYPYAE